MYVYTLHRKREMPYLEDCAKIFQDVELATVKQDLVKLKQTLETTRNLIHDPLWNATMILIQKYKEAGHGHVDILKVNFDELFDPDFLYTSHYETYSNETIHTSRYLVPFLNDLGYDVVERCHDPEPLRVQFEQNSTEYYKRLYPCLKVGGLVLHLATV